MLNIHIYNMHSHCMHISLIHQIILSMQSALVGNSNFVKILFVEKRKENSAFFCFSLFRVQFCDFHQNNAKVMRALYNHDYACICIFAWKICYICVDDPKERCSIMHLCGRILKIKMKVRWKNVVREMSKPWLALCGCCKFCAAPTKKCITICLSQQ